MVLMLHRVLNDDAWQKTNSPPDIVVRERTFHDLAAHIAHEYEVVGLQEARPGEIRPRLRLVLTFDDGWSDNYELAFSSTRQWDLPFTVFVCSGFMAKEMPFWPERAFLLLSRTRPRLSPEEINAAIEGLKERSPWELEQYLAGLADTGHLTEDAMRSDVDKALSWPQVLEMRHAGVAFGCHTHTHQILTRIPIDMVRADIGTSKMAIERALSTTCQAFAYPNGSWSVEARQAVANAGFELALTTQPGAWTKDCDPMAIPRMNISEENVTDWRGRFSPRIFDYHVCWKAWRALRNRASQTPNKQADLVPSHSAAKAQGGLS